MKTAKRVGALLTVMVAAGLTAIVSSQDLANGTLQLTGLNGDSTTQSGWGYYPIDGSRTLAIEVDGQQLCLLLLEAVSK
jgi:hypothetical protein